MNCGFKLYKQCVISSFNLYGNMHRYIPVIASGLGFKCGEVEVKHHPRTGGKSKYGTGRLLKSAFDFITVMFLTYFAQYPLYYFGSIGMISFIPGSVILAYFVIEWLKGEAIRTRPILVLSVFMILVGIQFFAMGLLGEMMVHFKRKRKFFIREVLN